MPAPVRAGGVRVGPPGRSWRASRSLRVRLGCRSLCLSPVPLLPSPSRSTSSDSEVMGGLGLCGFILSQKT